MFPLSTVHCSAVGTYCTIDLVEMECVQVFGLYVNYQRPSQGAKGQCHLTWILGGSRVQGENIAIATFEHRFDCLVVSQTVL